MLLHGPVRVPKDARPGKAIVRVKLAGKSKFASIATDLDVTIE